MCFNVPMGENVTGVVLLGAGDFDLLETPLGKIDVGGLEITSQSSVPNAKGRGESSDLGSIGRCNVADNFNSPMVFLVAHRRVAIAGDFVILCSDRGRDLVRVQVTTSLRVQESNFLAMTNEYRFGLAIHSVVVVDESVGIS